MKMKKILVSALHTHIFIDEFDSPEEEDRIKVWDTNGRYVDYFPIETLISVAEELKIPLRDEYETRCAAIAHSSNIHELISVISTDEFIIAHKTQLQPIWEEVLASDAYSNDDVETALNWSIEEQVRYLKSHYDVNIIGDFVLLNQDAY